MTITLLIVPYGIETLSHAFLILLFLLLLIVPYGIETLFFLSQIKVISSFNRTLWN